MTPDITRHDTEANLARDSGVCADTRLSLAEQRRIEEQARAERIQFCPDCGHRVPWGCEHVGEVSV